MTTLYQLQDRLIKLQEQADKQKRLTRDTVLSNAVSSLSDMLDYYVDFDEYDTFGDIWDYAKAILDFNELDFNDLVEWYGDIQDYLDNGKIDDNYSEFTDILDTLKQSF